MMSGMKGAGRVREVSRQASLVFEFRDADVAEGDEKKEQGGGFHEWYGW